jgi:hypothetical protein
MSYNDPRHQAKRIEELIVKLESCRDPGLLSAARELVQSVMDMHSAGLEQMLDIVSQTAAQSDEIVEQFGRDEVVGSLLVLHGIHPFDLETRVELALERVRANPNHSGGVIELLSTHQGTVHIRLWGKAGSLKKAVADAIYDAAPDLEHLTIEGGDDPVPASFVPLEMLMAATPKSAIV